MIPLRGSAAGADAADPRRGRYLVRNPALYWYLRAAEAVCRLLTSDEDPTVRAAPTRVLVAVGGHIGDAILATGAIRLVRTALPDAEIGVLAGSWARPVLDGHPDVSRVHVVDHWRLDRSAESLPARWLRHRRSRSAAIRALAVHAYEAAIDLYPYFPNMSYVLRSAGIPVRVGFESGGFGPLYTTVLPWQRAHVAELNRFAVTRFLAALGRPGVELPHAAYALAAVPEARAAEVRRLLAVSGVTGAYSVVHVGAGSPDKTWSASRWRDLLQALGRDGQCVVVTGGSGPEAEAAAQACRGLSHCHNLAGRLAWDEFVATIAGAQVCVAPDTAAAHVAGAMGVPVVVLWRGANDPQQWGPIGGTIIPHGSAYGNDTAGRSGDAIDVTGVMEAVDRILQESR